MFTEKEKRFWFSFSSFLSFLSRYSLVPEKIHEMMMMILPLIMSQTTVVLVVVYAGKSLATERTRSTRCQEEEAKSSVWWRYFYFVCELCEFEKKYQGNHFYLNLSLTSHISWWWREGQERSFFSFWRLKVISGHVSINREKNHYHDDSPLNIHFFYLKEEEEMLFSVPCVTQWFKHILFPETTCFSFLSAKTSQKFDDLTRF